MIDTPQIQLYGRIFIEGQIEALSGLHIGGSNTAFTIGGNDNAVIVNPMNGQPYIPGSSLKGKMRSLTEKYLGLRMTKHANVQMHTAESSEEYEASPVAQLYGIPAEDNFGLPTRLVFRDVGLTKPSADALRKAKTDLPYTEVKTEVSIDRITSQANPRSLERVPAGAIFGPMQIVMSIYRAEDIALIETLFEGMQLLEDDYLGGSGSRGSGRIRFNQLRVYGRQGGAGYATIHEFGVADTLEIMWTGVDNLRRFASSLMFEG